MNAEIDLRNEEDENEPEIREGGTDWFDQLDYYYEDNIGGCAYIED